MVDYDVPFYGNTEDNMHCGQATLLSIRAYFEPEARVTWPELDAAVGNPKSTGTWRMAGMMWMKRLGYEVCNVELLDYAAFSQRGLDYVAEYFGQEVAAWEAANFDIPAEQKRARQFALEIPTIKRAPTIEDIRSYLSKGYLVQLTVNANKLHGKQGFVGHAVTVKGCREGGLLLHDPGLPPAPNMFVPDDLFCDVWNNGRVNARTLTAYKR
jgi:hypothetical protein